VVSRLLERFHQTGGPEISVVTTYAKSRKSLYITPALPLFAQLRRFTLAVLAAAETAADFAGILYTDAPAGGEADAAEPFEPIELEKRALLTMPGGWKMSQMHAEQPSTGYAEFKKEILNKIARCLNMPFNVASGNSSGYNYASGRLDHQTYYKSIRVEQQHIAAVVLDRILTAWLNEAILVEGFLPPSLRILDADFSHQWMFDGHEHVDPAKEANAQATRLTNHTTTLATEYARQGRDWEAELRQRAKERQLMEGFDIPRVFGDGTATIHAGFSTVSLPGILENVMNKTLLAAYEATGIATFDLCSVGSVSDFKEVSRYRLLGTGGFEQAAPDGELKHGKLSEQKYSNKADTYGQVVFLTRQEIINDDLGAFMDVPTQMGRDGAQVVDELFFTLLLSNANSFFSTGIGKQLATVEAKLIKAKRRLLEVDSDMIPVVSEQIRELVTKQEDLTTALKAASVSPKRLMDEAVRKSKRQWGCSHDYVRRSYGPIQCN
jgi:hypothetical protein